MNSLLLRDQQQQREGDVDRVCDAITGHTGSDVFGTLRSRDVDRLVREFGVDALLAEIPSVDPTGLKAPAFVAALGRRMRRDASDDGSEGNVTTFGPRTDRARTLRAELTGYRTQLEALLTLSPDDDGTDIRALRDNIDRVEAELGELGLPWPA